MAFAEDIRHHGDEDKVVVDHLDDWHPSREHSTGAHTVRPTPVVDVARVREVTRGQAGLLRQFTRLLEVTLSESMPALSSPDPKVRRRAAHRLKGACANMGAASLTALFTTLETDPGLPAHETLDRVEQTREETVHALEALAQLLEAPGI